MKIRFQSVKLRRLKNSHHTVATWQYQKRKAWWLIEGKQTCCFSNFKIRKKLVTSDFVWVTLQEICGMKSQKLRKKIPPTELQVKGMNLYDFSLEIWRHIAHEKTTKNIVSRFLFKPIEQQLVSTEAFRRKCWFTNTILQKKNLQDHKGLGSDLPNYAHTPLSLPLTLTSRTPQYSKRSQTREFP